MKFEIQKFYFLLKRLSNSKSFDNYQNFTVKRIQLPDNIIKRTRRFKKIKEMNKIEKMKHYDKEEIERKEKLIRVKQDKFINRNILLTNDVDFQRVGKKGSDSPHPLKHLARHVKKQSDKKIEKGFQRINKDNCRSKESSCVVVDILSPMSDAKNRQ